MHEKCKAELCVKQFVIFIKNEIRKSDKRLLLDQGQKFGIRELEFWTKEKKIKMELTVAFSSKMNDIAECTNGFIASKARCLLLDTFSSSKIG